MLVQDRLSSNLPSPSQSPSSPSPSPSASTSALTSASPLSKNTTIATTTTANHQNDNVSIDPLTICTDLNQAAKLILHQSFAILQVDKHTHRSITHAWTAASEFFSSSISFQQRNLVNDTISTATSASVAAVTALYYDNDDDDDDDDVDDDDEEENNTKKPKSYQIDEALFLSKYRRVSHGNLLGFNRPSPAKVLFRAFCSDWGKDNNQPWPHSRFSLKRRSVDLSTRLHDLLVKCVHKIRYEHEVVEIVKREEGVISKRRKTVSSSTHQQYHLIHRKDTTHSALQIPTDMMNAGLCPLDYFFYHALDSMTSTTSQNNNGENDAEYGDGKPVVSKVKVVNCSEHVDRGILICISLTNVLGLEVMLPPITAVDDVGSCRRVFVCPETVAVGRKGLGDVNDVGCTDLVCILSGDQLNDAVRTHSVDGRLNSSASGRLGPCVHRVRSNLEQARLSITYELRGKV